MNKHRELLTICVMSLALLGVLALQVYWTRSSIRDKEEMFSQSVSQLLKRVGQSIEQREMREYIGRFMSLVDSDALSKMKDSQIREFVFVQENKNTKETFIYTHGVLQRDYTLPSALFDNAAREDSTKVKSYLSRQRTVQKRFTLDPEQKMPKVSYQQIGKLSALDKAVYEETFRRIAARQPLTSRVSRWHIDLMIQQELADRGMKMKYEFGILRNGVLTKVHTKDFLKSDYKRYKMPILHSDDNKDVEYELVITFPDRNKYLLASTIGMASLSFVLILLLIFIFIRGLLQIRRQKQVDEIKTDFINNMTHEFKTPIATINLALDAMKNPMVYDSKERLQTYMKMIRDENKRMHAQVENVLRISRLDKKQLSIEKERLDVHYLIEEALAHIQLLLEEKQGSVKKHLKATQTEILANDLHFVNVLVNILENAIKYSQNSPEIDIYTENVKNHILIKIQDRGVGMSKAALRRVFEKFYREHTGDLHNVKGHGLGLAYVKRIVEDHQGEVYAESEKGKGSTFYVKIPIIY